MTEYHQYDIITNFVKAALRVIMQAKSLYFAKANYLMFQNLEYLGGYGFDESLP